MVAVVGRQRRRAVVVGSMEVRWFGSGDGVKWEVFKGLDSWRLSFE